MSPSPSSMRIAIIGAGGAGSCTALELATRGHSVELFDRQPEAVSQATFANEGKIHLGFIYAKDESLRTANRMIEGALEFENNLNRWMSFSAIDIVSTPFYYGVHRGSLMNPDELSHHYRRCNDRCQELADERSLDYLGMKTGSQSRRLVESEYPPEINPEYLDAVFETTEYAVDPCAVSESIRKALYAEPRITVRTSHRVLGIRPARGSGFSIRYEHEGIQRDEWFSDVANTSWHERLPLDRPMGIVPPAPWSHRYKFGHRIQIPLRPETLPSCTYVQGPFGDIVNFRDRGMFLSWYPVGRTSLSTDEIPPDWHADYTADERHENFERSLTEWLKRCPTLGSLGIDRSNVAPYGGVIYALGTTDVDDGSSPLHERFEIGIQSRGHYHSLDTGKFTLVPFWAVRLADRIEGSDV